MTHAALSTVLDATADLVVNDGFDHVSLRTIAHRAGMDETAILGLVGSVEHVLVDMLNREYSGMYRSIQENVDRDPRGGLLSRIYFYTLTAVYEHPVARALYLTDPPALNRITRTLHGFDYMPGTQVRSVFIERMRDAGMTREIDPVMVSAMLTTFSAGLAMTSPNEHFDLVVRGIEYACAQLVDADVADTAPGKRVFFEYAESLRTSRPTA